MAKYTFEIEKVENGEKVVQSVNNDHSETDILFLMDMLSDAVIIVALRQMNEGEITELKVNRDKDGSVHVSITGAQDRIFAKVWRADNG